MDFFYYLMLCDLFLSYKKDFKAHKDFFYIFFLQNNTNFEIPKN